MLIWRLLYPFGVNPSVETPAQWAFGIYVHPYTCLLGILGTMNPMPEGEIYRTWSLYIGPCRLTLQYLLVPRPAQ